MRLALGFVMFVIAFGTLCLGVFFGVWLTRDLGEFASGISGLAFGSVSLIFLLKLTQWVERRA